MQPLPVFEIASVMLFCMGLFRLVADRSLIRRVLAVNVMGSGAFVLIGVNAMVTPGGDPVAHALVLTGLVIAVSVTALAIGLARRVQAEHGAAALDDDPATGRER